MDETKIADLIAKLKAKGIIFEQGLTDEQILAIEKMGSFQFPPDLKAFLQVAVPIDRIDIENTGGFPNWHDNPQKILDDAWEWTIRTFTFDIEKNNFWMDEWGTKPENLSDALTVATDYLKTVPKLIPIYAHRFMPAEPVLAGNPVFSVYQAVDSIVYGVNLEHYLHQEFLTPNHEQHDYRKIRFWDKIIE